MSSVFEEILINVLKKSAITCIILDIAFTTPVHSDSQRPGNSSDVLRHKLSLFAHRGYNLNTFRSAGILPLPPPLPKACAPPMNFASGTLALPQTDGEAAIRNELLTCLPGSSPTIPTFMLSHDLDSFFIRFYLEHLNPQSLDSVCVLCNSFTDLEDDALNATTGSMNENVLAVGLLVLDGVEEVKVAGFRSGLLEEDLVALTWPDDQAFFSPSKSFLSKS